MAQLRDVIKLARTWDTDQVVAIWNDYVKSENLPYQIYKISEFNDYCKNLTPLEIIELASDSMFYGDCEYFGLNADERIESFDTVEDYTPFDIVTLAEYIINNNIDYSTISKCEENEDVEESLEEYVQNNFNQIVTALQRINPNRIAEMWNSAIYYHNVEDEEMKILTTEDLKSELSYLSGVDILDFFVCAVRSKAQHTSKFFAYNEDAHMGLLSFESLLFPWNCKGFDWGLLIDYIFMSGNEEDVVEEIKAMLKH